MDSHNEGDYDEPDNTENLPSYHHGLKEDILDPLTTNDDFKDAISKSIANTIAEHLLSSPKLIGEISKICPPLPKSVTQFPLTYTRRPNSTKNGHQPSSKL